MAKSYVQTNMKHIYGYQQVRLTKQNKRYEQTLTSMEIYTPLSTRETNRTEQTIHTYKHLQTNHTTKQRSCQLTILWKYNQHNHSLVAVAITHCVISWSCSCSWRWLWCRVFKIWTKHTKQSLVGVEADADHVQLVAELVVEAGIRRVGGWAKSRAIFFVWAIKNPDWRTSRGYVKLFNNQQNGPEQT